MNTEVEHSDDKRALIQYQLPPDNNEGDVIENVDEDVTDDEHDDDDGGDADDDDESDGEDSICSEHLSVDKSKITTDQEQEWRDAFEMFDTDHNGTIEFEEFAKIMRLLGGNPTDAELNVMMQELDSDSNGTVELDEFIEIMTKYAKDPVDEEAELIEAFRVFDRNNDGFVDSAEIKYVMNSLGHDLEDSEIDKLITIGEQESGQHGMLDYKGFIKIMQQSEK